MLHVAIFKIIFSSSCIVKQQYFLQFTICLGINLSILSIEESNKLWSIFFDRQHRKVFLKYNNDLVKDGNNNDVYEFGSTMDELELWFTSAFIVKHDYLTPRLLNKLKEKII